jgi:tropomyosin, fungi type
VEADAAVDRAEAAEAKVKKLEQEILQRDQEIQSLTRRLQVAEGDLEKLEGEVGVAKKKVLDGAQNQTTTENLQRKVQLLEEELDAAERNTKETVEK